MIRRIEAILLSPTNLSSQYVPGNFAPTLPYIPGTAVRGALASLYLADADLQREITEQLRPAGISFREYFDWLFLSGKVIFPNLYPSREEPSRALPLSARSCKRYPGFPNDEEGVLDRPHGVWDILLAEPPDFRCTGRLNGTICRAPMEQYIGFYAGREGRGAGARTCKPRRRLITRTALDNPTEIARPGFLYSIELLEEGGPLTFSGNLVMESPDGLDSAFGSLLQKILLGHLEKRLARIWLGRAKSRGLGAAELRVSSEEPPLPLPPLEQRFEQFQPLWRTFYPRMEGALAFSLTLDSDAIVLDRLWRYCSLLDPKEVLAQEVPGGPPCRLERWFTQVRVVSGWNAAHRLPKEDQMAILKGAAFLYTTDANPATLLPWLAQIETQGIGERRNEGFGRVIVYHPFHLEVKS